MATHMVRVPACDGRSPMLCKDYLREFQVALSQFGQAAGVQAVLLLDLSGRVLGSWYTGTDLHIESIASLISGKWAAAHMLAGFVAPDQQCNLIIHEYNSFRLLLARAGSGQLLLSITAAEVPVGWTRLQMQRLAELCSEIEQRTNLVVLPPLVPVAVPLS